jgi:hypothetical protein
VVQQQGIVKGDVLQKITSAGFILGAILIIIFSLLFSLVVRVDDPSVTQEVLNKWGGSEVLTEICALLIAIGVWAVMLGVAGLYRSISARGAAWARLGFYGILLGTALSVISNGLTMATAGAAANMLAAPAAGQATAYSVAASLYGAAQAVETMSIIFYWLAFPFIGIGMVLSAVYPKWLGWVGIVLGPVTVAAVGIIEAFKGISSASELTFGILGLLSALWALVIGIWVARKAW